MRELLLLALSLRREKLADAVGVGLGLLEREKPSLTGAEILATLPLAVPLLWRLRSGSAIAAEMW